MFRGDWGKRPSVKLVGIAVASLVAVGTLSSGIIYGLAGQASYAEEANEDAAEYAAYAAQKISKTCALIPIPAKQAECIKSGAGEYRLNTRDNQREYQDLSAQRTSALWTGLMGIAALIGMALSVVGVALVWTTFREAKKGNVIAREVGEAQVRCYLSIEKPWVEIDEDGQSAVSFNVVNSGQSPARKFRWGAQVRYFSVNPFVSWWQSPIEILPIGKDVPPGKWKENPRIRGGEFPGQLKMDELRQSGSISVFATVELIWEDVFGNEFRETRNLQVQTKHGEFRGRIALHVNPKSLCRNSF